MKTTYHLYLAIRIFLGSSALLILGSGCVSKNTTALERGYRPSPITYGTKVSLKLNESEYVLDMTSEGQIMLGSSGFNQLYGLARTGGTGTPEEREKNAAVARDFLVTQFMAVSDNLVERHKARILGNYAQTNATLGILTSLAGGLSAVFAPVGTKSALGASSALFNSARATVNEEVFLNQVATTIVGAIDQDRRKLRIGLEQNLKHSTKDYTIDQAMRDVQEYQDCGSFSHGLVLIAQALAKQPQNTDQIKARITDLQAQYDASKTNLGKLTTEQQAIANSKMVDLFS